MSLSKSSCCCLYDSHEHKHCTHPQGQTIGRAVDLSVTRLYKTSKTFYTPLAPVLWLLLSAAAKAGRTDSVVKAPSTGDKPV